MSGTDLARRMPTTAARLVCNPEADQRNAWEVLVSAFGQTEAASLVAAQDGGTAALAALGLSDPRLAVCGTCEDYVDAPLLRRAIDGDDDPTGEGWVHVSNDSSRCPGQEDDDTDDRASLVRRRLSDLPYLD